MTFSAIATLVACGGGSSGTPSNDSNSNTNNGSSSSGTSTTNSLAGIYTGKLKASTNTGEGTDAISLITSEGDFVTAELESPYSRFIGNLASDKKSASGKTYVDNNGTLSATNTSLTITNTENNALAGTYAMTGNNGTFSFTANTELYNRGSSYAKLAGTWTNTHDNLTLVAQNNGSFSLSVAGESCQLEEGQFNVFNSSKNEYKFTMKVSNCDNSDDNGDYSGFAFISDTSNKNDTLNLQGANGKTDINFRVTK